MRYFIVEPKAWCERGHWGMGGAQRSSSVTFTAVLFCFYGDLRLFSQSIDGSSLFIRKPWSFLCKQWQALKFLLWNCVWLSSGVLKRSANGFVILAACLHQIKFLYNICLSRGKSYPTRVLDFNWFSDTISFAVTVSLKQIISFCRRKGRKEEED